MRTIQVSKRAIARLLVVAGVAAVFATGVVAANAAESAGGTATHSKVVSSVEPAYAGRCDSWCTLRNYAAPWQCLDADTANIHSNGDKVQLWGCSGGWNQQWRASSSMDKFGGRWLINRASGKCLDIDMSRAGSNGARVMLWDCGGDQTHWKYYTTYGSWTGRFQNMYSYKCLDADSYYLGNGGKVQQWSCSGGNNQSWNLNDV
jgi:hypothetical protein